MNVLDFRMIACRVNNDSKKCDFGYIDSNETQVKLAVNV